MSHRVLIDLLAVAAGGQVTRARAFLELLRNFDKTSQVTVVRRRGFLDFVDTRHDLDVIDVQVPDGRLGSAYRMSWENVALPVVARARHIDTFITFSHYLPRTLARSVRTIVGVSNLAPFSSVARSLEPWGPAKLRLIALKRTILASAKRANTVMALSSACREVLIREGIPASKISVVSNGVDHTRAAESADILSDYGIVRPFVLYVSHFYRYKNFESLVRGYGRLPMAIRQKYSLVLVGRPMDQAYFQDVQALVDRLDLRHNVRIIPGVAATALGEFYARAAVFVFPSYIENCPNILLEAMQSGAAVASSISPPMPEFGADAVLYFDPYSPAEIAARIEQILGDEQLERTLRQRAAERAREYSWERFTCQVVDLYTTRA